ncbi:MULTISPECIES: hypothetical protein [Pseudomonas syringae group]|uniref:hypothetical protein n=1 Tax=Pseudomonas syringae group TaxID=136849 RepID=UPI0012B7F4C1|nr:MULTISPECIES: hypothetical protein [Pseudomonas syringae group]
MSTEQPNKPIALLVAEVKAQALNAPATEQSAALARINVLVANLKTYGPSSEPARLDN